MVVTPTMTYASGTWTLTEKHEKMIKTTQRKMLRLIVQTKRRYKQKTSNYDKKKTRALDKKTKKTKKIRPTKKLKRAQNKTQTKTRTATYLSRKMPMKKLTPLKTKKIGSHTSKGAPKRLKNTWKNPKKCWIETYRRLKWRMERRIISLPEKIWTRRVFDWHPWARHLHQNTKTGRETQEKMGRRPQRIPTNGRKTGKNKVRLHEQQQLDERNKGLQKMERK